MSKKDSATPDEWVVHYARVWRDLEKVALGNPCETAKGAEYEARKKLRSAVDMLRKRGSK